MHQRAGDPAVELRAGRWAGVAGTVAGIWGLAIAEFTAWAVAPTGSPVPAVGELIISILPGPLVNWGKETLGAADKPFLIGTITIVVLVICGVAGRLERRQRFGGAAIFALVAVIGLIGVTVRSGPSISAYVPTIVGLLLGYMLLSNFVGRLWRWLPRRASHEDPAASRPARRAFLGWTLGLGVLGIVAAFGGSVLTKAATAVNDARSKLKLPTPAKSAPPVPAGADLGLPDLSPYLTPNEDFYRIDTALQVPEIDPAKWQLTITGMVAKPLTISYDQLAAKPLVEHHTTLTCVSNEVGGDLIGTAAWLGYPIRDLLAEAQPAADADMVLSTSEDGWTAGTPLSALTDPGRQALLAIGMNGAPLPLEHGFPVRMVVPGLYGYVSATKWVTELKVTTFARDEGYWTPLGWSALGPIKLASRIDVPRKAVNAGDVVVAGVAWCQHVGISKVEVQVDDGDWRTADLAATTGPDTWRQWRYTWAATPGTHTLRVRATDAKGDLQVSAFAAPAPDGSTGYHQVRVKVR